MCTEETVMVTQNVGAYDIILVPHCIKLNSASSYIVGKDMSKHECLVLIEWSVSEEDKIKYSVRAVHFLLPWLKALHQEQTLERSVEASIEGNMILLPPSRFLA